jgi:Nucleotidyltransferase domain
MAEAIRRMKVRIQSRITRELLGGMFEQFDELVLFGSRAADLGRPDSDWDILCVGDSAPRLRWSSQSGRRTPVLDIVWLAPAMLNSEKWLGSELANHIKNYGVVIRGRCPWRESIRTSEFALERKLRTISIRSKFIAEYCSHLAAPYLARHKLLLRRDLQRLDLLTRDLPIPPSLLLDDAWSVDASALTRACELARAVPTAAALLEESNVVDIRAGAVGLK